MRTESVYCGVCVCGQAFETPATYFHCAKCKRELVISWPEARKQQEPQRIDEPKKRSAA